ncbi:helix-turn-helix domain-containing protein [Adhaeribacter rhizoryzae]|uniref:Helix-turn-helix transcriptional regulator n=1 Tax=Adhaeribacter rhizoryzae TaxID=2607907 RepID=A0A5M6DNH3_9BACT|nr:helix-turn-helix transcriptional regulator [Adhaeribacter rhizoryzae]KAA5547956.1 helix-turn-helix transcriptional regulator [Adhaeribacter rhizoryzae]
MLIGKRIEEAIKKSGLKPQDVAMYAGVSYARLLSFYKLDSIELKYLRKIAQRVNLPLSYFLSDLDPGQQSENTSTYSPSDLHLVKENIQGLHRQLELCHVEIDRLKRELSKTIEQITFVIQENKVNSFFFMVLLNHNVPY